MKALMAAIVFFAMGASTALADPPANDDIDNATLIVGLPFFDAIDTSEATTADDDPDCVGQGPTVWYAFTPIEDIRIEANTFDSNYDTTLAVYVDTPEGLVELACNDDAGGTFQSRVRFDALAEETYFFMVGAFASGPGGMLQFSVDETSAPLPLAIDLSIDPLGQFIPRTGEAVVSGILTCSKLAFAHVFIELTQGAGRRFTVPGFGGSDFECDGETAWSATIISDFGFFAGGPAKVAAFASAFDPDDFEFAFDEAFASVRLRGGRK